MASLQKTVCIIFSLILLASCVSTGTKSANPQMSDISWLTDKPCKAPCWHGLEIGRTSKSEALVVINSLTFIDSKSLKEQVVGWYDLNTNNLSSAVMITFHCKDSGEVCGYLTFFEDKLQSIVLELNFGITLSEVVNMLGNPDFSRAVPVTPEIVDCDFSAIWSERQMIVTYYQRPGIFVTNFCDIYSENGNKPPLDLPIQTVSYSTKEFISYVINDYNAWLGFSTP
jgi:hypothetical protein